MDLERKLEILQQCDFSAWRKWPAAGLEWGQTSQGFGGAISGLKYGLGALGENGNESRINYCLETHQSLMDCYARIPFDEMDANDEDFKYLFDFQKKLDEIGTKLKSLADFCREHGFDKLEDRPDYKELYKDVVKLGVISGRYRDKILAKYGIDLPKKS